MLSAPLHSTYNIRAVCGHRNQCSQHSNPNQERSADSYTPTLDQSPSQQVIASTSALRLPASTLPPYYQSQPANSWLPQCYQHPVQCFGLYDDISPAFKGKAFIYDCMVRALESLSPQGASVKEIFGHVWLHNRAFILARSRDGDTEADRRASTKNTIVNYLSTSPAFDSVGRNRWILTGKKHGIDKRGRKFSRSTKRKPHNSSRNDVRDGSGTQSTDSNPPSSSTSSTGSPSPDLPSRPAHHETTWDQPSISGGHTLASNTTTPLANNLIDSHRPATVPPPLSNGQIQGPAQASMSATSPVPNDLHLREHWPQQQRLDQEGLIVSALPSHEARLDPGMRGTNTTSTGTGTTTHHHPQWDALSFGRSAQSTTTISTTTVALARGFGTRRSFDAVPLILPPRPPRTLHPGNLDPFAAPILTSGPSTNPASPTSTVFSPITPPSKPLFQIPSNMSYYVAPSVTAPASVPSASYAHQENNPSPTLSSSSFHPRTLGQRIAQADPQGDGAGTSIPVVHQHHNNSQVQRFGDHDTFSALSGFV